MGQEVFQAATKTFYRTDGPSGAFVFLGVEHWAALPVEALLTRDRDKAEAALGDDFDVRAFHAEVLKDGSVPLDVLEDKINRWIAAQQA
mgnify:CR=1 FL=1